MSKQCLMILNIIVNLRESKEEYSSSKEDDGSTDVWNLSGRESHHSDHSLHLHIHTCIHTYINIEL